MLEISKVEVSPASPPVLCVTFANGEITKIPLHPPVVAVLNAGGWLMREYVAQIFEDDLGGSNLVSRRIRMMEAGERVASEHRNPPQTVEAAAR